MNVENDERDIKIVKKFADNGVIWSKEIPIKLKRCLICGIEKEKEDLCLCENCYNTAMEYIDNEEIDLTPCIKVIKHEFGYDIDLSKIIEILKRIPIWMFIPEDEIRKQLKDLDF